MTLHLAAIALYLFVGAISVVRAQTDKVQVNISMCSWRQFRANVIRDTVYLDGGTLWWRRGFSDDTETIKPDPSVDEMVFTLSFNSSFDTKTTDLVSLFGRFSRGPADMAPKYIDGVMFANDDVLFTYGGLLPNVDEHYPPEDSIWGYEAYQYGPAKPYWEPTAVTKNTGDEVTRYITNGAGVSAPSENLGFYFSGMHAENYSEIRTSTEYLANETSSRLITINMAEFGKPKFSNFSIDDVRGRANAELVWLPVSESGALIAIGGVTHPEVIYTGKSSEGKDELWEENEEEDPKYMKSVAVYDVAGGNWYIQETTGDTPPPLAMFCSVLAIAEDKSSYNIYIYGGYNGTVREDRPSDDVYVLSIPSFKWIKVYKGEEEHGRIGHKCVKPYPDQMMVLGGFYLEPTICPPGGIIQVFNLNKLEFQNTYDPEEWEEYFVPEAITKEIGGDEKGGAKTTEPEEGWADEDVENLFKNEYTKSIETWYPYEPAGPPTSTPDSSDDEDNESGGGSGFPKWAGAVLGVVLGLVVITGLAVIWLILRRRRERSRYPHSVGVTSENNNNRILGWMYNMGMSTHKADMTTTSTEIGINDKHASAGIYSESGMDSVSSPQAPSTTIYSDMNAPEAGGRPIHEMQAGTVTVPTELPTSYNELPTTTRHLSDTPTYLSPISPAVSPTPPDHQEGIDEVRSATPSHNRHNSSISSTGFPLSLDNAVTGDNADNRVSHHRVSGFKEDFSTEGPPDRDDAGDNSSKAPSTK